MLVLTDKDRQKRKAELEKPQIDLLLKKSRKGNMQFLILQEKYGMDGDFNSDGRDWGTGPRGEE